MLSPSLLCTILATAGVALAGPVTTAKPSSTPTPTSTTQSVASLSTQSPGACFSGYPETKDSTGIKRTIGLQFWIFANNPLYDGRSVQLRALNSTVSIPVLDDVSPVLAYEMTHGTVYNIKRNGFPGPRLGPVAGLQNVSVNATTGAIFQNVLFQVPSDGDSVFKETYYNWDLEYIYSAVYSLYQKVSTIGIEHGFTICDKGDYKQLSYYKFNVLEFDPPDYTGCEFVGLRSIIAPLP